MMQAMVTEVQEFTLEVLINDDGQTYIGLEEYRTFEDITYDWATLSLADRALALQHIVKEINLVGAARSKEVKFQQLNATQKKECLAAMAAEWAKWTEFSATKKLPSSEMSRLLREGAKPVGCRWVLTIKDDGTMKARLVVQGS